VALLGGALAGWLIHQRARSSALAAARERAARPQPTPAPGPGIEASTERFRALEVAGEWEDLDDLLDELERRAPVVYRAQHLGYLHARAAQLAGEDDEAEQRLQPWMQRGEAWRPLALWHAAEVLASDGREEQAMARRRELLLEHPGSLYWQDALDAQLAGLERGGDARALLATADEILPLAEEAHARRELQAARVAALVRLHRLDGARKEALGMLARSTRDDAAERVALLVDKPELLRRMDGHQLRDLADSMLHHRRWDRAVDLYLLARRALPKERGDIDFWMGRARFFAERYTDALRLYRRAATNARSNADRSRDLFHAARAAQLLGQDKDAESLYTAAIAVPGKFDSTTAALAGRLRMRVHAKRLEAASGDLVLLRRLFPRDAAVAEGAVALAMGQLVAGEAAAARLTLGILPASLDDFDKAEAAYWRGRARERDDGEGALASYLEVLRAPVPTHFAFLARHRLAQAPLAAPATALVAQRRRDAARALADGDADRARELQTDAVLLGGTPADLQQLGRIYRELPAYREVMELRPLTLPRLPLPDDAAPDERLLALGLLDEAVSDVPERYPLEPLRSGLTRAEVYRLAGASRASIGAVETLMHDVPEDFVPQLLPRLVRELLFPRYFYDTITEQAARYDADPRLLLSIMREESRFNPRAKSSAAARGLMQFLLSTARDVAVGIGLAQPEPEDLYDPRIVIELGAKYVGDLQKQFGGDPYATAAAYNAGPSQSRLWLELAPASGHDYFLSTVGFDETKNYVRKVLNSYERYGEIYQGEGPTGGTRAEP